MKIFLARNNQQAGPYNLDELNAMLANGQVKLTDLMWHKGMAEWKAIGEVTGNQWIYHPDGAAPFPASGTVSSVPLATTTLGATHQPVQTISLRKDTPAAVTQTGPVVLAGIGQRLAAYILDSLLSLVPLLPLVNTLTPEQANSLIGVKDTAQVQQILSSAVSTQELGLVGLLLLLVIGLQLLLLAKRGQTLGKLALGIRIVDKETGQHAGFIRVGLLRYLAFLLLYNVGFIGIVIMLVDLGMMIQSSARQSLHDRLARTIVVKNSPKAVSRSV